MECGRLVAPSSGITGPNPSKIFCCRRCIDRYYQDQLGLWEQEERQEQIRLEHEQEKAERFQREQQAWDDYYALKNERKDILGRLGRYTFYFLLCLFIFFLLRSCS